MPTARLPDSTPDIFKIVYYVACGGLYSKIQLGKFEHFWSWGGGATWWVGGSGQGPVSGGPPQTDWQTHTTKNITFASPLAGDNNNLDLTNVNYSRGISYN